MDARDHMIGAELKRVSSAVVDGVRYVVYPNADDELFELTPLHLVSFTVATLLMLVK